MTLEDLYDLNEKDLKKMIIYEMRKFKKLEEKQEKNFEELKKQEEYESENKVITSKMVSDKNRIQLSIMNTSKLQEELKNKIEMLRQDYERFTRLSEQIEESLDTLYEYKLLKENSEISDDELSKVLKDEEELNINLAANKNELRFLKAEIVSVNKEDMEELLHEEQDKEYDANKNEDKNEDKKDKLKKDEEENILEVKEFSMPKYNYNDLMSIYNENMESILNEEKNIDSSIAELEEYIDNYDEDDDDIELEEKISEKEELEENKESLLILISEMETIKQEILVIKEKEEELKELNEKIAKIKEEIEKQTKILEQENIEKSDKEVTLKKINDLKKDKNKLVENKNNLIVDINSIGEKVDQRFKEKIKSNKDKKHIKKHFNNVKYNDASYDNVICENTNYTSSSYTQSLDNTSNLDKLKESNVVSENIEDNKKIFNDDQRQKDENLPITNNKDIVLKFVEKMRSGDSANEFFNDNFNSIVSSLINERSLKSLTKQEKKDLKLALKKYERKVCYQIIERVDPSNVDTIMYEIFNDDIDKLNDYKDVKKDLFNGLYSSNLNHSQCVLSIGNISKLNEKSINFLNDFFNAYYLKLENGEIEKDTELYKCINRLVVSPVKLSIVKKYNKDIQNKFLYTLSNIKEKFTKNSEGKKNKFENLKNNISFDKKVKSDCAKSDSLGIKSMVKEEMDLKLNFKDNEKSKDVQKENEIIR